MPFQQLRVHIPFATEDITAYTRKGKKIQIMANPYLMKENITFTIECNDPYWKNCNPSVANGIFLSADTAILTRTGATR